MAPKDEQLAALKARKRAMLRAYDEETAAHAARFAALAADALTALGEIVRGDWDHADDATVAVRLEAAKYALDRVRPTKLLEEEWEIDEQIEELTGKEA